MKATFEDRLKAAFKCKREPARFTELLDALIIAVDPLTKSQYEQYANNEMYCGPRCVSDSVSLVYRGLWSSNKSYIDCREFVLNLARLADKQLAKQVEGGAV